VGKNQRSQKWEKPGYLKAKARLIPFPRLDLVVLSGSSLGFESAPFPWELDWPERGPASGFLSSWLHGTNAFLLGLTFDGWRDQAGRSDELGIGLSPLGLVFLDTFRYNESAFDLAVLCI